MFPVLREGFSLLGVVFEPFTPVQAELAAQLWEKTRRLGLSLADRACLALAMDRGGSILTADRAWGEPGFDLSIELIR